MTDDTATTVQTARDKAQDDVFHDLALTYTTADAPEDTDMVIMAAQGPSGGFAYIRTTPLIAREIAEELLTQANDALEDEPANRAELVRAKGLMDGANTLAECAESARQFANYLQELHDNGHRLTESPVVDDYAFYSMPTT